MKKEYLKKLEAELIYYKIENKDEVLEKYRKRYEFGIEAGLTEENVETMLGNPEDIVKDLLAEQENISEIVDLSDKFDIEVNTLSDNIEFVESADDGVHVELEGVDETHYNINKTNSKLEIRYKKSKFFSLNRKKNAIIKVEIPKDQLLGNVVLSTTTGKIKLIPIRTNSFKINVVSADITLDDVDCNLFMCHTVSGDVKINTLTTKELKLDAVSGDINIEFAVAEKATIDLVSGDVVITDGKIGSIVSTSVSGDVIINGEEKCVNVKNYVKGMFRK